MCFYVNIKKRKKKCASFIVDLLLSLNQLRTREWSSAITMESVQNKTLYKSKWYGLLLLKLITLVSPFLKFFIKNYFYDTYNMVPLRTNSCIRFRYHALIFSAMIISGILVMSCWGKSIISLYIYISTNLMMFLRVL